MRFEHKIVLVTHIVIAVAISATMLFEGFESWFLGPGIVTPILLVTNCLFYLELENDTWYKEQMVPFISRVITTTESETDRYCQYHRRLARFVFVIGYFSILFCQWFWTWGFTEGIRLLGSTNAVLIVLSEVIVYVIFFGPFLLFLIAFVPTSYITEKILLGRYSDIVHLLDIEHKWTKENTRRKKESKSAKDESPPFDRQEYYDYNK